MGYSDIIKKQIAGQKEEYYINQRANIINSDWVIFLTPEMINNLLPGKTNKGRYMGFSFLPKTDHGFDTFHSGFSTYYIEFCKLCHKVGFGKEEWNMIKSAHFSSPLAKQELNPNTTIYGNNWVNISSL